MVDGQFQVCDYVACNPNYQIPEFEKIHKENQPIMHCCK